MRGHENFNHRDVFTCVPSTASIAPGEDLDVKIMFSPDHERVWPYEQQVKIVVPNQTEDHVLHVVGRCWARQVYVVAVLDEDDSPARRPISTEDVFSMPEQLRGLEERCANRININMVSRPELLLKFPRKEEGEAVAVDADPSLFTHRKIVCGCIGLNDAKMGGGGTFEVEFDSVASNYFVAQPDKGACAPGQETEITFEFKPPTVESQGGLSVGQWIRIVANVHTKGGFKSDGQEETRTFPVILEGYIHIKWGVWGGGGGKKNFF